MELSKSLDLGKDPACDAARILISDSKLIAPFDLGFSPVFHSLLETTVLVPN